MDTIDLIIIILQGTSILFSIASNYELEARLRKMEDTINSIIDKHNAHNEVLRALLKFKQKTENERK